MIRAHIEIKFADGSVMTYVNSTVTDGNGKNGLYYAYLNTAGNKMANQTGAGKVAGDYATILASANTGTGWLAFPEGTTLTTKNQTGSLASIATVQMQIKASFTVGIKIVEREETYEEGLERTRIARDF